MLLGDEDPGLLGEDDISAFCDQIVGAWTEANQQISTVDLLKDAIHQAREDGRIKQFISELAMQDEVILVGVHLVDPPPKQVSLTVEEVGRLIQQSLFAELCQLGDLEVALKVV